MKLLQDIFILGLIFSAFTLSAQNITNQAFYQEGQAIIVTYKLDCIADVSLKVSLDGGKNFSQSLQKVTGHVGTKVQAGNNRIIWDALAEFGEFHSENVVFLISAYSHAHNGYEYVDLGLPSGLLWATCNVGANRPEEYGNYFAFGEIEPKNEYSWSTYIHGTYEKPKKYFDWHYKNDKHIYNRQTLDLADDAAHVHWGGNWHIPSVSQVEELWEKCRKIWTTYNGVQGMRFIGPNGNSIFLPAGGYMDKNEQKYAIQSGYYWSANYSNLDPQSFYHKPRRSSDANEAFDMWIQQPFANDNDYGHKQHKKYYGQCVRPVCDPEVRKVNVRGVEFNMRLVQGGTFMMGATQEQGESANADEKPAHKVSVRPYRSYYMGETEVTHELWKAVMGKYHKSYNKKTGSPQTPVTAVSREECEIFLEKIRKITGYSFYLPTEAEWEFAARGGNQSKGYKYSGSNSVEEVAWTNQNSNGQVQIVATKKPNELGLYDMSGNAFEWCVDTYNEKMYTTNTPLKAIYDPENSYYELTAPFVVRGGSYVHNAHPCRVSARNSVPQKSVHYTDVGFRLCWHRSNN